MPPPQEPYPALGPSGLASRPFGPSIPALRASFPPARQQILKTPLQNTFVVIALPVAAVSAKGLRDGARGDSKWLNCDD